MMLADMGARVIKVETPGGGDESRGWGPPFVGPDDQPVSTYFLSCNRNKESVTLDLKSDEGRDTLARLVTRADVLLENFRPGVLDRLGFPVERLHELNPGLVLLSISGFGHDGPGGRPRRLRPDRAGRGRPDVAHRRRPRPPAARRRADRRPARRHVRRLRRRLGAARAPPHGEGEGRAHLPARLDRRRPRLPGHAVHRRGRGRPRGRQPPPVDLPLRAVHVRRRDDPAGLWQRGPLAEAGGGLRIDTTAPGFATNRERVGNRDLVVDAINAAFADIPLANLLARLADIGIPAGEVRTLDRVYEWEQTRSQGLVIDVEHPLLGRIEIPGPPIRLDDNAYAGGRSEHTHPPLLGEHNDTVLAWLDDLDDLDRRGVPDAPEPPGGAP